MQTPQLLQYRDRKQENDKSDRNPVDKLPNTTTVAILRSQTGISKGDLNSVENPMMIRYQAIASKNVKERSQTGICKRDRNPVENLAMMRHREIANKNLQGRSQRCG